MSSSTYSFPNPGNPQVIVSLFVLSSCMMAGGLLEMRTGQVKVPSRVENRHFQSQLTASA